MLHPRQVYRVKYRWTPTRKHGVTITAVRTSNLTNVTREPCWYRPVPLPRSPHPHLVVFTLPGKSFGDHWLRDRTAEREVIAPTGDPIPVIQPVAGDFNDLGIPDSLDCNYRVRRQGLFRTRNFRTDNSITCLEMLTSCLWISAGGSISVANRQGHGAFWQRWYVAIGIL